MSVWRAWSRKKLQRASGRHPEDVVGAVFVDVLGVGEFRLAVGLELGIERLEAVRDVFQEDQAEHDMLVLRRIHAAPERVRHLPELLLEADVGAVALAAGDPCSFLTYPSPCPDAGRGKVIMHSGGRVQRR